MDKLFASLPLAEHKLDALLITGAANVRYLTGFTGSNGMLLATRDEAVFFTDPRYRTQSAREVRCRVKVASGPLLAQIAPVVSRKKIRKLGFEKDHTTVEQYEYLRSSVPGSCQLVPGGGVVERIRMVKTADEIALIRKAVATNSKAFEKAIRKARLGMTEAELAAEIDHQMRLLGAERPAFETIVASGTATALPHARPGRSRFAPNQFLLVDMGANQDGYCSDMTRMAYFGRPDRRARDTYRAVLDAQLAAIAAVKAGTTGGKVDQAARRSLRAAKMDQAFVHSTGHGLGLDIHEAPRLGKKDQTVLEAGMAITIEPGVYFPDWGGIRIEDTVIVTANGCDVLTPTAKDLRELM